MPSRSISSFYGFLGKYLLLFTKQIFNLISHKKRYSYSFLLSDASFRFKGIDS